MSFNAAAAYQNSKVQTASGADLTLMLYEGAIKFCNIAKAAIEKRDIQGANTNIQKAERIILELQATLDFKYPVAENFNNVYKYIQGKLFQANIKKDADLLEEALTEIRDMRDIWKQVMAKSRMK
ncbi:flagellar export chaperone FliS [[Clostridium] polysaccharolyticum]|uniref:Flagellar protein FliS n=1 Tax=[Clostridium] polysaccharolyticum TaxID=29364 RepID=A0A1I0CU07_9FIRM|nr:flagellar export chaperone FliS [[Clostridium] polysaccharolyticum]SET23286.1 flagellar protein FliS [[Clostridium] polysaccharolyticum]